MNAAPMTEKQMAEKALQAAQSQKKAWTESRMSQIQTEKITSEAEQLIQKGKQTGNWSEYAALYQRLMQPSTRNTRGFMPEYISNVLGLQPPESYIKSQKSVQRQ